MYMDINLKLNKNLEVDTNKQKNKIPKWKK